MKDDQNLSRLLTHLRYAQLSQMQLDAQALSLHLRFTFETGQDDVMINLSRTVHIAISKNPEDDELPAVVGEVTLNSVENGGLAILTKLGYPFRTTLDPKIVFTFPSILLCHFHMEGDVCVDVVCGEYGIQKVKRGSMTPPAA
jgi:hypothetical protein